MIMNKIILPLVCVLLSVACTPNQESQRQPEETAQEPDVKASTLDKQLLGAWSNVSLKVTMAGETSDSVLQVAPGQWENVLQIKPIVTVFKDDFTYTSEYTDLDGNVILTRTGEWTVNADSVKMTENGSTNQYHAQINGDRIEFSGYIDWDEDGQADDLYWGEQQRVMKQNL